MIRTLNSSLLDWTCGSAVRQMPKMRYYFVSFHLMKKNIQAEPVNIQCRVLYRTAPDRTESSTPSYCNLDRHPRGLVILASNEKWSPIYQTLGLVFLPGIFLTLFYKIPFLFIQRTTFNKANWRQEKSTS